MHRSNSRRRLAMGTTLLAGTLALAACGVDPASTGGGDATPDAGADAADSSPGQIRATWWGGDSENSAINDALDLFTEETGVEVGRETQAWDGYWDRLATQTAGRNAPDLIMQAGSRIPDYAGRDALLDLNTLDGLDVAVVDEGLREFGAVDNQLYGVVAASNAMGLIANEELLSQAGVSLPESAYDWDQLAQSATSVHEAMGDGVWGIHDGGGDLILFILSVRDDGRQFYADDGSLNATREDLTAWLQYWEDLRASGGAPPADVTAEAQGSLPNTPLAQGNAAMAFGWTQDYVAYTRLMDADLSINLPPYDEDNPSLWMNAASLWSVASSSESQEDAASAINFLINDEEAIRALGVSLGMPPSQHARDLLEGSLGEDEQAAMDYMGEVAETSTPLNRLWPVSFSELRTLLSELNEAVAFGTTTVPEAVDQFFQRAEELG